MTTHIQLNPMIPVVTPDGPGYAFIMTDYSQEHERLWCVMLDSGQFGDYPQSAVRAQKNISMGRIKQPDDLSNNKGKIF